MALYFDMFDMARKNLSQAVSLRTDDARARYYYGQVLKLVARTDADRQLASTELNNAIKLDSARHFIPEAQLQRALLLIDKPDSASREEAVQALKDYVTSYQTARVEAWRFGATLPPNMETLYDYLRLLGDTRWKPDYPNLPMGGGGGELLAAGGGVGPSTTPSAASKFDSSKKARAAGNKDAIMKAGQAGAGVTRMGGTVTAGASQIMQQVPKQ
jgi:hypothetical protein